MDLWRDFRFGSVVYPALELCKRGRTHWSMCLAGGAGMVWLRRVSRSRRPLWRQALRGGLGITMIEYAVGRCVNRRYRVWDYRKQPLNLRGQICAPYALLWCGLSALVLAGMRAERRT